MNPDEIPGMHPEMGCIQRQPEARIQQSPGRNRLSLMRMNRMNWPPDQVRLSVLMERWNHAIGLAIMLSVSNPLRKLQESIRHFFICESAPLGGN
jgi:hypothetical protein